MWCWSVGLWRSRTHATHINPSSLNFLICLTGSYMYTYNDIKNVVLKSSRIWLATNWGLDSAGRARARIPVAPAACSQQAARVLTSLNSIMVGHVGPPASLRFKLRFKPVVMVLYIAIVRWLLITRLGPNPHQHQLSDESVIQFNTAWACAWATPNHWIDQRVNVLVEKMVGVLRIIILWLIILNG